MPKMIYTSAMLEFLPLVLCMYLNQLGRPALHGHNASSGARPTELLKPKPSSQLRSWSCHHQGSPKGFLRDQPLALLGYP